MEYEDILKQLKAMSNPRSVEGMARYGINPDNAYGVSVPDLRKIARKAKKDHALAQRLWSSAIHEARILASMIADPKMTTAEQMDSWVKDINSWDVCDQCCLNLFVKTEFAYHKAQDWSKREEEFVRRAGFALMACLAVSDKKASDSQLEVFFPIIKEGATDNRNYVKKAVNWALRQIGKRNRSLNLKSIEIARDISNLDARSTRWIASDALRELTSQAVQYRLKD